jgi:hypothetical protein
MKPKTLAILNFLSVILTLFVNYYTQAVKLNGNTIGSLSSEYVNLFTPASYAFAIWGVIYLGLLAFSSYQLYQAFGHKTDLKFLQQTNYWFILANLANAAWVVVWLYEYTGLSIVFMLLILFSLVKIILNTNMERWDAPLKIIAFSWWPICLYSGWIAVATIANFSAYLAKIGWSGGVFSEVQWTVIMIVIAAMLNIIIIYTRNMREFAAVGIWALFAIFIRHYSDEGLIAYVALGGAILIGLNAAYHGFINRKTNPIYRVLNK